MKIVKNIPVYLLSLLFLVFGSNFFLHFISLPNPSGDAGTFIGVIYKTDFLLFVKTLEIIFAVLLIIKPTRPLALILIAPVSLNILLFELFIAHQPGIGVLLVLLNATAIFFYKERYMSIIKS